MNDIKKKSIVLSVIVMLMGLMIVGGTYAYLTAQANVTNTNYIGVSTCFLVDYDIDNGDGTQNITGTLFPSISPVSGLNGRAGLKVKDECEVSGIGELKLHINNTTSSSLMQKATSHCEDKKTGDVLTEYATEASCSSANQKWRNYPASYCEDNNTLQVLKDYTTSGSCTANNGTWVTNGSPLKYAVYNSNNTNTTPIRVGHITSSSIGNDVTLYDNIILTHEQRYFYVYIWLDGYLTDNSHAELPFDGYIKASATQNDRLLPSEYEEVEYLKSTGTQYIDTGIAGNNNNLIFDIKYSWATLPSASTYAYIIGSYTNEQSITTRILQYGPSKTYFNLNSKASGGTGSRDETRNINTIYEELLSSNGSTITYSSNETTATKNYVTGDDSSNNICIFAKTNGGAYSKIILYYLKISNGNDVIRNFIPCYRKNDSVRGLYDIIEGKFYTNAGTGTFEIPT